jgi:hypothetical protein
LWLDEICGDQWRARLLLVFGELSSFARCSSIT